MRTFFYRKLDSVSLAVADLCDYYGKGLIITRINVPKRFRGKGIGSFILQDIISEADASLTTLFLEISASDGLDEDQLRSWYERHGFRGEGILVRKPKSGESDV